MGQNELLLIALFAAPVGLILLLRANAAFVFASMCVGYVLSQFMSADAKIFTDGFLPQAGVSANTVKIGLIIAPALLTTIFMLSSMKGPRMALNLVPSLAVGCLSALLIVPLLSPEFTASLRDIAWWSQVVRVQDLLIGGGALICLLSLWLPRRHKSAEPSEKKHS